jgi:hypothetical protein
LNDESTASYLARYVERLCNAGLSKDEIIDRVRSRLDQAR